MKRTPFNAGERFGRLVLLREEQPTFKPDGDPVRRVLCRCDCGTEKVLSFSQVRRGATVSCGCLNREVNKARWAADHAESAEQITARRVREVLEYAPDTGIFKWKMTRFPTLLGKVAGSLEGGYIMLSIDSVRVMAHRVAWLYVNGEWPREQIDHINGIKTDNRIANLRDVSPSLNKLNVVEATSRSKLGVLGVSAFGNGYRAAVRVDGKEHYLGIFSTIDSARAAYIAKKRELNVLPEERHV